MVRKQDSISIKVIVLYTSQFKCKVQNNLCSMFHYIFLYLVSIAFVFLFILLSCQYTINYVSNMVVAFMLDGEMVQTSIVFMCKCNGNVVAFRVQIVFVAIWGTWIGSNAPNVKCQNIFRYKPWKVLAKGENFHWMGEYRMQCWLKEIFFFFFWVLEIFFV